MGNAGSAREVDLLRQHAGRIDWLESARSRIVALPTEYPDGHHVPFHHHGRSQLLYALTGVVMVTTRTGRWMVPPDHAMWIPAGEEHSVESIGHVSMRSVYVLPNAITGLPDGLRVVGLTPLMRNLMIELGGLPSDPEPQSRAGALIELVLHEIPSLPTRPLGLPFPVEPRLATLCRRFLEAPSPHATIDGWARTLGMSRRAFTRAFHRETGLSLSTWRQQACLLAALPRLARGEAITSVALDLGYESAPAFTTMFKRMLGAAPRNYLRAHSLNAL